MDPHTEQPRHLSLFSGAGGGEYATKLLGWRTVCYVERDPYCQRVIQARIRDGIFDDAPIWGDVATFDGKPWRGLVDVISAGFPCQPFSAAGRKLAYNDPRNGWLDTIRIVREIRPRLVLLENVPGLLSSARKERTFHCSEDGVERVSTLTVRYFSRILGDLAESGYDASWCVLSAARLGAPHLRKRLWILAALSDASEHRRRSGRAGRFTGEPSGLSDATGIVAKRGLAADTECYRLEGQQQAGAAPRATLGVGGDTTHTYGRRWREAERDLRAGEPEALRGAASNTDSGRCEIERKPRNEGQRREQGTRGGEPNRRYGATGPAWGARAPEPVLRGVDDGVAHRRQRLRALGNGQVPIVAATAFRLLHATLTTDR